MNKLLRWIYSLGYDAAINDITNNEYINLPDGLRQVIRQYYLGSTK